MNGNSDKHKPLSPEELFRLLETKNESALAGDDLDDFEKEALEGFSAHTSAQKARELTEEVHQRIHEQLDGSPKKRPAARIIWFGAAASVVVGLVISAYILTREAKFSDELALNKELTDKVKEAPAAPALEEAPAAITNEQQKQEQETKPQVPAREIAASQVESTPEKADPGSEIHTISKDGDFNQMKNDVAAAEVNLEKSKDESKKSLSQAGSESELKLAEISEQENRKAGYVSNGAVAANKALAVPKEEQGFMAPAAEKLQKESPVTTDERYRNTNVEKTTGFFKKGKKLEDNANMYDVTTATGSAKTEDYKAPLGNARAAYYVGGEQALKAGILTWFKEHQYEAPKGNYNVRMKIGAEGGVQVLEIKGEKNQDEKVLRRLEECLKSLKNWNPAISDQEATESETAFTLGF